MFFLGGEIIRQNALVATFMSILVLLLCLPVVNALEYIKEHSGKIGRFILSFVQ